MPDRLKRVYGLVVHCSASRWGDAPAIDSWHKGRGWSGIGYHAVILNGIRNSDLKYQPRLDGKIEPGRSEDLEGAHTAAGGMNEVSLGACLIGIPNVVIPQALPPRDPQLYTRPYVTGQQYAALVHWLAVNCRQYELDPIGLFRHPRTRERIPVITQHSDHEPGKPYCASINIRKLREQVAYRMKLVP